MYAHRLSVNEEREIKFVIIKIRKRKKKPRSRILEEGGRKNAFLFGLRVRSFSAISQSMIRTNYLIVVKVALDWRTISGYFRELFCICGIGSELAFWHERTKKKKWREESRMRARYQKHIEEKKRKSKGTFSGGALKTKESAKKRDNWKGRAFFRLIKSTERKKLEMSEKMRKRRLPHVVVSKLRRPSILSLYACNTTHIEGKKSK